MFHFLVLFEFDFLRVRFEVAIMAIFRPNVICASLLESMKAREFVLFAFLTSKSAKMF